MLVGAVLSSSSRHGCGPIRYICGLRCQRGCCRMAFTLVQGSSPRSRSRGPGCGRFPAVVRRINTKRFRYVPVFCCYSSRKQEHIPGLAPVAGTQVPSVSSVAPMTGTLFRRIAQQPPEHQKSQIYTGRRLRAAPHVTAVPRGRLLCVPQPDGRHIGQHKSEDDLDHLQIYAHPGRGVRHSVRRRVSCRGIPGRTRRRGRQPGRGRAGPVS